MTKCLDCVSLGELAPFVPAAPSLCHELCRLTSFLRRCPHQCVRNDQSHELCHSPTDLSNLSKQNAERNGRNQKNKQVSQKHEVSQVCQQVQTPAHFFHHSKTVHKICIEPNKISSICSAQAFISSTIGPHLTLRFTERSQKTRYQKQKTKKTMRSLWSMRIPKMTHTALEDLPWCLTLNSESESSREKTMQELD